MKFVGKGSDFRERAGGMVEDAGGMAEDGSRESRPNTISPRRSFGNSGFWKCF